MRVIYGICVSDIVVNRDKLVKMMKETPADSPSEKESVYDEYISECKEKNIFSSPEDWIQNYVFQYNYAEKARGIGALIYKNIRINSPTAMVLYTTGTDGDAYIGIPSGEPSCISQDMRYTPLSELKRIIKIYVKKISDMDVNIGFIQFE